MAASQWRFESFRLDPVNACLWRGAEAVVLTPKTFDVLYYLVLHADRLVTKDELLDAVWPETAVSDGVVRMAISALRKALDDIAQTPRFIATVPRRGYRFVAAVTRLEPPVTPRAGELPPMTSPLPRHENGPPAHTLTVLAEQNPTARVALAGERKQVTVLFADITDSLSLIHTLDPEAAQQLLDPALQRMMDAVHHYAGTVNQVLGDGLMALFGAPLAHEDHALRACYAALAMQAALREYTTEVHRPHGVALQLRVGLNSGEVVVRALRNDVQLEYSAVGTTTHLAARMEQVAVPGTIVLTAATGHLVEGLVRLKALGPVPVKGLPEPLAVYELLSISALQGRFQAAVARGLTRLVGREAALASVHQALERAAAGYGQVVAVLGEAGMGKSRLVHECLQQLAPQGWRVLTGAALSYTQATPYFPVVTLLKRYFHLDDGMTPPHIQATLTAQVQALDARLQDAVPALLALLDALPADDPFWQLDPVQRRVRILDALKRLLVRLSQTQPVVLVVEDLHWLDTETQTWLDRLEDSLPAVPLLLLVNYRPTYQHGWGSKTYYTQLRLDPLPPASITALVRESLGDDASLAPLIPLLIAHTEGNPFFLEESLRTLIETHALVGTPGAYRLVQTLPTLPVPATVQAVLAARIDRLPPDNKRLLQTAAVIGMDVSLPVLHAVLALPEAGVQAGLTALQAAEFLYETQLFPDVIYTFKHALTRQVAVQSVLHRTRHELHRQIADVLETQFASTVESQPERLAHHYTEAGLGAQAVTYWQRAGQRAMDRSAPVEAVSHLSRGLEVLATLPETLERLQQELDLQVLLGAAWTQISGFATPALRQVYTRARELGQRLGASQQLLAVLVGQFGGHLQRAELQAAQEVAIHLLMQVQGQRDPLPLLAAHTTLGIVLLARGEVVAAHRHLAQGITLHVPTDHRTLVTHHSFDFGVAVRGNLAMSLWMLGAPEQALGHIHALHALAQELSYPPSLAYALVYITRVTQWRRNVPATLRWSEVLMACCTEYGFAQHLSWAELLHGWALLAQGQREQGLAQMRQGLTAHDATQAAQWRPYFLALLAEGYGQTGAPDEGLRLLAEALVAVQHTDEHMWEAELHRLQGELLLQAQHQQPALADDLSRRAAVEASLRQALTVARRQQAKSLELRATMSLARFWQQQGKRAEAQALLAPVYGWFTEGFDTADLQEARTLLGALC
jgi:class 3 adenylate cyclase/predicted ATPase